VILTVKFQPSEEDQKKTTAEEKQAIKLVANTPHDGMEYF
jgi:hypothetical protein